MKQSLLMTKAAFARKYLSCLSPTRKEIDEFNESCTDFRYIAKPIPPPPPNTHVRVVRPCYCGKIPAHTH